jgi:hypothetical protein
MDFLHSQYNLKSDGALGTKISLSFFWERVPYKLSIRHRLSDSLLRYLATGLDGHGGVGEGTGESTPRNDHMPGVRVGSAEVPVHSAWRCGTVPMTLSYAAVLANAFGLTDVEAA